MKTPSTYLANTIAPSAGYSIGQLKDNPGDNTGSGIVSQTHNDFLYGFMSMIAKYAAITEINENETVSDFRTALERFAGAAHSSILDYSIVTTYALNDQVFSDGIQYVSAQAANTGNVPGSSPDWWIPIPGIREMFRSFRDGQIMRAGMDPTDDPTPSATYQTWFKYGIHNIGGNSGQDYQAYKVHLDGSVVTGDADLETIFAPGLADEYRFIDTVAPDSLGTRTMIDYSASATGEAVEGCPYIIVMLPV